MPNEQKWIKGWKVITPHRASCSWRTLSVMPKCYYHKNEITKRPEKCGPLTVFRTRQSARNFKKRLETNILSLRRHNFKIVKCLYQRSKDTHLWSDGWYQNSHDLPTGTDFADSIICLE